jgi:3-oxoacyl-[acyl-carrier protein] reductase
MKLEGKTVMVTGAGRGLGQCMAQALAARGARVALAGQNRENLEKTAELCREAGGDAHWYVTDVSDEAAVEKLFADAERELGAIHGLINNAGVNRDALLVKAKDGRIEKKMSLADWRAVIDVDLTGVFLCAREAAVRMIEHGDGGVIVNISSISRAGNIGQSNYTAAKAGVAAVTVTWAKELARHGVRVAAIAPGFCNTGMVRRMKSQILDKIRAQIPLGRLANPEEIAHTALYIFENDYLTGRVVEVDGGLRM